LVKLSPYLGREMKRVSKNERKRRQHKKKHGGFYFHFNYDEAKQRRHGVTKDFYRGFIEEKYSGGKKEFMAYPPEKIKKKMHNISTGKTEIVEMDRCCAQIVGSDPPKRCKKAAIKGIIFCRSHGGEMLRTNKERDIHKYSEEELREQIEALTRGDLLDIKEEIAITIIVLKKHLERMLTKGNKMDNRDTDLFLKIIDTVTKNVERLNKMKYGQDVVTKEKLEEALSRRSAKEIEIIDKLVEDEELKKNLIIEFSSIQSTIVI